MEDFIFAVQQFERFPVVLACVFAALAYGLIREAAQSGGLALVSVPLLIAGSLTCHYLFTVNSIILVNDKDTNVAAGVAIGMLVSFALLMLGYSVSMLISERISARKKLKPLGGVMRTDR